MASKNTPTNKKLYASVKAAAKKKFKVYPSAYANAWLVREYKKRGGGYTTTKSTKGRKASAPKSRKKNKSKKR